MISSAADDNDSTTTTTTVPTTTTSSSNNKLKRTTALSLSTTLLHQCRLLLAELDCFFTALATRLRRHHQQQHLSDMRQLRSNVLSELRTLERLGGEARALLSPEMTKPPSRDSDIGGGFYEDEEDISDAERRLIHTLRSSNLPFYAAVWTVAKERCKAVVAFGKRFYWDGDDDDNHRNRWRRKQGSSRPAQDEDHQESDEDSTSTAAAAAAAAGKQPLSEKEMKKKRRSGKDKRKSVMVDIVADNGEEWVKVSTISENRLLFEMAEKGWDRDSDTDSYSDDEVLISGGEDTKDDTRYNHRRKKDGILRHGHTDTDTDTDDTDADSDDEIELVKLASDMNKAARATRIKYKHPRIRFVIPKLIEGKVPEIDAILNQVRGYGVAVECGTHIPEVFSDEMDGNRDPAAIKPEDLPLSTLLPNPFEKFTSTLNVDCTLLLALVSDLSHVRHITTSPSFHRAINRQIEIEEEQPLVPTELWPAMVGRHLICTEEAAQRMKEIVDVIGTSTEKERTAILLAQPPFLGLDKDDLLRQFQRLSDHDVPKDWLLPIKVIDAQPDINAGLQDGILPPVAHKVTEVLSDINRSVFVYGWVKGIVTVSSNRTVVKQIEHTIEENRDGDDDLEGPPVWVCDTARSLVGKEKKRKP
jgi:hypothetical protein